MRFFLPLFALLCAAALPANAQSGASGSGGGFSGSGTFVATQNQDGSYTIDSLTGDASSGIGSLIASGGFNGNDNLLFPGSDSQVDGAGFSFTDLQGDTAFQVNIFSPSDGDYSAFLYDSDGFSATIPVTFSLGGDGPSSDALAAFASPLAVGGTGSVRDFSFAIGSVAATPEPSGLLLLGTGLLCVCGFARRRFRSL